MFECGCCFKCDGCGKEFTMQGKFDFDSAAFTGTFRCDYFENENGEAELVYYSENDKDYCFLCWHEKERPYCDNQ